MNSIKVKFSITINANGLCSRFTGQGMANVGLNSCSIVCQHNLYRFIGKYKVLYSCLIHVNWIYKFGWHYHYSNPLDKLRGVNFPRERVPTVQHGFMSNW